MMGKEGHPMTDYPFLVGGQIRFTRKGPHHHCQLRYDPSMRRVIVQNVETGQFIGEFPAELLAEALTEEIARAAVLEELVKANAL